MPELDRPAGRRRWPLVVGAIVIAVIVAAIAGTVIVLHRHNSASDRPAPTNPAGSDVACNLPGTPGPSVTGATSVRWDQSSGYALPISATDGPARRDPTGSWTCYAHTPSGAVLAAYTISLRVSGVAADWQEVARQQTIPGPGQTALLAAGLEETTSVTPRGFHLNAYDSDRATIAYYERTGQGDFTCTEDAQWYEGDWRLVLGDDGSTASSCTREVPAQFTPWGP